MSGYFFIIIYVFSRLSRFPLKSLHQQYREFTVGEKIHTQEQYDVRVTNVRHQLAFLYISICQQH